jgi:alginate O-acetyltransferase complex protein AlgI
VDPIFADPGAYNLSSLWMGACLFIIQIYCDFSGYSDMAVATAALLGYRLPLNFNFPYLVTSLTEGWRRWHITLYSFMRDYLYISLGGARVGPARQIFNVLLTMILVGFWHGASWNFVLFGLYHGIVLVMERVTGLNKRLMSTRVMGTLYALTVWLISTPLFRTKDLDSALTMMSGFLGFNRSSDGFLSADYFGLALILGFALVHVAMYRGFLHKAFRALPDWIFALLFGACAAVALAFTEAGYTPFIYFQF